MGPRACARGNPSSQGERPAQPSGFNGAASLRSRKWPGVLSAQPEWSGFNGAASLRSRKSRARGPCLSKPKTLQWGRELCARGNSPCPTKNCKPSAASMGPRACVAEMPRNRRSWPKRSASMGPRAAIAEMDKTDEISFKIDHGFNGAATVASRKYQRVRTQPRHSGFNGAASSCVAEMRCAGTPPVRPRVSFNGAATLRRGNDACAVACGHLDVASMGPRSLRRGNADHGRAHHRQAGSFNGAASSCVAEMQRLRILADVDWRASMGPRAVASRKFVNLWNTSVSQYISFNGAAIRCARGNPPCAATSWPGSARFNGAAISGRGNVDSAL